MSDRLYCWIGLGLVAVSILLRLTNISIGPYHADSLLLALQSEKIVDTRQMHYLQSSGLPLTALTGAFFVGLYRWLGGGDPVAAVNWMSVVIGGLTVVPFLLLCREWFDRRTGVIAGVFFVFHPLLFGLSTFGNSHVLSVFYLLWSIVFLSMYPRTRRLWVLIAAGVSLGCLGASRLQDLGAMFIPIGMMMLLHVRQFVSDERQSSKSFKWIAGYFFVPALISIALIGLMYAPKFLSPAASGTDATMGGFVQSHLTNYIIGRNLISYWNLFAAFMEYFSIPERILIVAGAVFCLFRERVRTLIILLVWIVVPVALNGVLIFFVYRFLAIIVVPLSMLCGYGVSSLAERGRKFFYIGLLIGCMGLFQSLQQFYPAVQFRHHYNLLPEFYQWAGQVTEEGAYILERDNSVFIQHYARRKPLDLRKNVDRWMPADYQDFQLQLDHMLEQNIPIYITRTRLMNRKDDFRHFMVNRYQLDWVGRRVIEDWHLGVLQHVIVDNDLLRIRPRGSRR